MKIHNQLEYNQNGEKVIVYNTMLKGALTSLADFSPYFNYLCVGSGRTVNNQNMSFLDNFISAYEMEISNYNTNINNGNLYITKSARVRAVSPMSISEVGVSRSESGEGLVNRFVLPTAIEVGAGGEVLLTLTINL